MVERIRKIVELSKVPMKTEKEMRMVEIIVLKFKDPEVEVECVRRIIENTDWSFKLNIYDNRQNTASTARIWNKLIDDSTCDYVMFIDSDAFVPKTSPCWLTRMMESFNHKDCWVVVPTADNVGGANQKALGAKEYPAEVLNCNVWSGFCWLFKRDLVEKAGWLDEKYYFYGQDSSYALRLKKLGIKTYMRRDVFLQHKAGYSGKKAQSEGTFDREADKTMSRLLFQKELNG